jgi:hypothetical protein
MLKFLKKPYPFNDDLRHNAKIIFFISIGVLIFILFFQPIDFSLLSNNEIFYLVTGIGASTFLVLSLNLIILPSLFPQLFKQKSWNIKKEILWNIWILFTITASDFLFYTKLLGVLDLSLSTIVQIILLGVLPVSVLIIINQDRLLRSHINSAKKLFEKIKDNKQIEEKLVFFESDYKKDSLSVKIGSLLFIRSANNYIEVFSKNGDTVSHQMTRCSISKAEATLQDFNFIYRCHRTFIVNINHIEKIEGNSQGYKLFFKDVDFPILVSQKYINEFKRLI